MLDGVDEALPQFPPAYRAMVRAALDSPHDAVLEPVHTRPPRRPYFPILRAHVGHAPVILPGAMAVIRNEAGEVLTARRVDDGLLDVPGGFADLGETTTAAIIREVYEETGLTVQPVRVMGVYSEGMESDYPNGDQIHGVGIAFECRVTGGRCTPITPRSASLPSGLSRRSSRRRAGPAGMRRLWRDIQHPRRGRHPLVRHVLRIGLPLEKTARLDHGVRDLTASTRRPANVSAP